MIAALPEWCHDEAMAANLSPEYKEAEERHRHATTPAEKLATLEEMLRSVPKHKGTEKLQADLKSRIALMRRQPKKKAASGGASHVIPKEGAGQVVLVGPPNSGKSSLVAVLTAAHPKVADYPLSTKEPVPGMMPFEDIGLQLVDLPALMDVHVEPWVYDIVRAADLAWLVVHPGSALDGMDLVKRVLEARRIELVPADEATGVPPPGWVRKRALLIITHADLPEAEDDVAIVRGLIDPAWRPHLVSARNGRNLEDLKRLSFESLGVMRLYTKHAGRPAERTRPFTLPRGATVGDLARTIHHDLLASLKFARIWGPSAFDGQQVHRDHVLADGDVVELHS